MLPKTSADYATDHSGIMSQTYLYLFTVFFFKTSKTTTMISSGSELRLYLVPRRFLTCSIKIRMGRCQHLIKVATQIVWRFMRKNWVLFILWSDSPAPCKAFPKTPKIALTIDDIPQSECSRRKSSGSSVHSNSSGIEPHIYDFQEYEKNVESSLIIRSV